MGVEKIPWETKLAILARFKETQGTAVVPTRYIDPDSGFRLGGWVHHLRQTRSKLTASQIQILEQMGFVWNASKEWPWETKLEALKRFYQEHAHYRVPRLYVDEVSGFKLGQWVPSLRRKNACLKGSRRGDLIKIGFFTGDEIVENEEEGSEQEEERQIQHLQEGSQNNNNNLESSSSINGDSAMGDAAGVMDSSGVDGNGSDDNHQDCMEFAPIPQMTLSSAVGVDDTMSSSAYSGHNIFMGAGGDEAMMNMIHGGVSSTHAATGGVIDSITQGLASMRRPMEQLKSSSSASPSPSMPYEESIVQMPYEESVVQVYEL